MVVIPLSTSATEHFPLKIGVSCLGKTTTAVCDQIRTVDKSRLHECIGSLSIKELNKLDDGLRATLSL